MLTGRRLAQITAKTRSTRSQLMFPFQLFVCDWQRNIDIDMAFFIDLTLIVLIVSVDLRLRFNLCARSTIDMPPSLLFPFNSQVSY